MGLVLASGIVLLYLAYDIETVHKGMPFDFKKVAALGVLLATGTAIGSLFFDAPFLTQTSGYIEVPIFRQDGLFYRDDF